MNRKIWRFSHVSLPQTILIHDFESAKALVELIKQHCPKVWKVQIEQAPAPATTLEPPGVGNPTLGLPADAAMDIKLDLDRDKRRHSRHQLQFKVTIISGELTFRTFSSDVSLGGMRLKSALPPDFQAQQCEVEITHPELGSTVRFTCRVLRDGGKARRVMFTEYPEESRKRLASWIKLSDRDDRSG